MFKGFFRDSTQAGHSYEPFVTLSHALTLFERLQMHAQVKFVKRHATVGGPTCTSQALIIAKLW